ncbi:MAG: SusC/RagA family TonB-linked outer membrane protein [Prevotella sp.]|nr:SusC/RagA family TonB-linked outer membrane protein [Candidatus Prevotella equi]
MKYNIYNTISRCRALVLAICLFMCSAAAMAQITSVHGTVSDDFGPLMGAAVCEIDGNGRIIESTVTDMNGNFVMKVKNEKDKLRISFVGLKTQTFKFDKSTFDVKLESATTLQEVTVKSKKRMTGNSLPIPEREVSFSSQSISTKEFEGLGINTIDEALQGRIAGLDIVGNSGNLGSGSTMRLRGSGSLSSLTDGSPLIVVDGNVRDLDLSNFDASTSNEDKFAELLNINTEDIASITVKKDAAATAIYGSQGSNGVIEITTKRGVRGKPKVSYSLKLTATYQPKGLDMLSGDDYTMLLKESYFNPEQSSAASNINEINYDQTWPEWRQYDDNTDWRDAVRKWGLRQNHYITVSGGGERATFRISGGFDNETGQMLAQKLQRFSTRVNLDYNISQRIRVQTNFSLVYTKNFKNSDDLLGIAQKKMPNMSIYEEDQYGNDTDVYYNMLQSGYYKGSDIFDKDQRVYVNPVASAYLAKNVDTKYDICPDLVINYELLGMDEDHHRLTYRGQVYMNIFNSYNDSFYPSELVTTDWHAGHNTSGIFSSKSVNLTTKHTLTFIPSFRNKDHSAMVFGRMELNTGSSSSQSTNGKGLPSGGIESPNAGGMVTGLGSSFNEGRSMNFSVSGHYAYKSRYNLDFTLRADGTTRFGPDRRWGLFPSVSLRWNVIDEPFMKKIRESGIINEFGISPSWGYVGAQPNRDYLYTSKYGSAAQYLGLSAMTPQNLKLTNLQYEDVNTFNLGIDLHFLNDKLNFKLDLYNSTRSNMLMENNRIPSSSGYYSVAYRNTGRLRNTGWEFFINTNKLVKKGKFTMDLNVNFSNNRTTLLEMDPTVLKGMNSEFTNDNRQILTRVQIDNPLNAIYGFRSKGVYEYKYETIKNMTISDAKGSAEIAGWANMSKEEKQQAWVDRHSAPVALNAEGKIIRDDKGNPLRMSFNYTNDGTGKNYEFSGGDAIYEDVNNDGQINALDIVYLGSSLPKLYGGFGFTMNYGDWRLTTQLSYRVGCDIINLARLDTESMIGNNNQSQAVNYRWRKEGDLTTIPRAMYGATSNYNTLISDRFVEDGSYLRVNYIQLSYALNKKMLSKLNIGLSKISFYLSANNPFVITKYTGVDPDISASRYSPAIDSYQTPRPRSFTFGMTVDF